METTTFQHEGCTDGNREATRHAESFLRTSTGRNDLYCTYSGFSKTLTVFRGPDEYDWRTWSPIAEVRYEIGVAIDLEEVARFCTTELGRGTVSPEQPPRS